jgi:fructokinase
MRALGLDPGRVQIDPWLPTGIARATLDGAGVAAYEFPQPAAWDRIEADARTLEAVNASAALVFGTLAQRSPTALAVVQQLVEAASWRVLDLNLRPPHDARDVTLASLARADFVKLNEAEAERVATWLGSAPEPAPLLECLAERFGTSSLCITRGAAGALLWHEGQWTEQAAFPCAVGDTVGAGDSFLAMLLAELLAAHPAAVAMERAARLAAFVASQPGAVPDYAAGDFRG